MKNVEMKAILYKINDKESDRKRSIITGYCKHR